MKIQWQKIRLRNKVLFEFIQENLSIVIILLIFAVFGFWLWQTSSNFKDFGGNFVSEMLGVLITILIINQLIVIREEKRKIPHKFVVYDDLRTFLSKFLLFWKKAFRESVPEDEPETIYQFYSNEGMGKIWDYMYVKAHPSANPNIAWDIYLVKNAQQQIDNANKLLSRHSEHLPPHIYKMIHQIVESKFLSVLTRIPDMQVLLKSENNPRNNLLESVAMVRPSDKEYASIIALYDWCQELYMELSLMDKSIDEIITYLPRKQKYKVPPATIPDKIINQEQEDWKNYLNHSGKSKENK